MASKEVLAKTIQRMNADPGLPVPNPTTAYWQLPPHNLSTTQSPTLPQTTDILIIGSGITACSLAKELLALDLDIKVTILEARTLSSGATGRNGGHIATHPVMDYLPLAEILGKEEARKICVFRLGHFDLIKKDLLEIGEELVEESEIRRVDAVMGLLDLEKVEEVKMMNERFEGDWPEFKGRVRIYEKGQEGFDQFQMSGVAGIAVEQSGAVWPYRMVSSIFAHLLKTYPDRLTIETQTPATAINSITSITSSSENDSKYEVSTPRGTIKAKQIAHCTNGHVTHLLPLLRGKIFPVRGHMSVQIPGSLFPHVGNERSWSVTWGTEGLDYITQNGKTHELFYGGGLVRGKEHGLDSMGNTHDEEEDAWTKIHLAGAGPVFFGEENWGLGGAVKSSWSGVMGFTGDGLPLVGRLGERWSGREGEGEWVAAGFNGYGMPNCWGCGKVLAGLMLGGDVGEEFPRSYLVGEERLGRMKGEDVLEAIFGKME